MRHSLRLKASPIVNALSTRVERGELHFL